MVPGTTYIKGVLGEVLIQSHIGVYYEVMTLELCFTHLDSLWKDYKEGSRRLNEGQDDKYVKATKAYKEVVGNKDRLFDMATTDPKRIKDV